MSELTRDEVVAVVHPIDDTTVAEIIATGVTKEELAQACKFVAREFKRHEHRDVPLGRVGRVISILERVGARPRSVFGEGGSALQ
jgi:hypothetical protein